MKKETDIQIELGASMNRFSGTNAYYEHMSGYHITDGVKYFADTYHSHWLLTEILVANHPEPFHEFQVWKLERIIQPNGERTDAFKLSCHDGDYRELRSKVIPWSNFKAEHIELWFAGGVLYLPSEH